MLTTVRQINGYPTIDVTPKNRKLPQRVDQTPDVEERQPRANNKENQEQVTLHDLIPPELLNLPEAILGKSSALASYLSNQSMVGTGRNAVGHQDNAPEVEISSTTSQRVTSDFGSQRETATPIVLPKSSGKSVSQTGTSKAAAVSSYLANNDEPVYVAVPDSVIASSSKASKLREFAQNITDSAKNAYYKFMTSVPYSVGMLINVFA
jgi:hypothetical protein